MSLAQKSQDGHKLLLIPLANVINVGKANYLEVVCIPGLLLLAPAKSRQKKGWWFQLTIHFQLTYDGIGRLTRYYPQHEAKGHCMNQSSHAMPCHISTQQPSPIDQNPSTATLKT